MRDHIIWKCSTFSYDLGSIDADSGYPHRIVRGIELCEFCFANEKYVDTVSGHMDAVRWMWNFAKPRYDLGPIYGGWSSASGNWDYKAQVRTLYWGSKDRRNWIDARINEINNFIK